MVRESKFIHPMRRVAECVAVLAACIGLVVVFGADLSGGIKRLKQIVWGAPDEAVPIELEIKQARAIVNELVPALRKNYEVIVREQVEIEDLRVDISESLRNLSEQRAQILATRSKLPEISTSNGSPLGVTAAVENRQELRHLFATYQSLEAGLNAKRQLLLSRENSLNEAMEAQNAAIRKKKELEAEVASFDARLSLLKRKMSVEPISMHTTSFEESEEIIRYIRKRLTVAERLANSAGNVTPDLIEMELNDEPIEAEIDRHFAAAQSAKNNQ